MTVEPLADAGPSIATHAMLALLAFVLALVQFFRCKGTSSDRVVGWLWVAIMAAVALSSFQIHTICTVGPFSAIHLLSIITLLALVTGVRSARHHEISRHRATMTTPFVEAPVIAGGFTLIPGRVMHDVVFADHTNDSNSCSQ